MDPITMEKLGLAVREAVHAEQVASPAINPLLQSQLEKLLANPSAVAELVAAQAQDIPKDGAEDADMGMMANPVNGLVKQLDGIAGQSVPWGSALAGGAYGLIVNELIDGFAPPTGASVNFTNVALKLGGAWVSANLLSRYAGRPAGNIGAGVLVFSVAREFTPIENGIQWIIGKIRGVVPTGNRFAQDYSNYSQDVTTLGLQQEFVDSNIGTDRFANVTSPH